MLRYAPFLALPFLLATNPVLAEDMIWLDYPQEGVVLGQGYNLLQDKVAYGNCVNFVPVQDPSQHINFRFEEVNSHSEVQSRTKISASGSMRMAILNASARLQFLSDEKFKLDTTKFILNAEVTNSSLFAAPSVSYKRGVSLPDAPVENGGKSTNWRQVAVDNDFRISTRGNALQNHQRCGHGFVAAIISGAAVDAFLTFSKSNAEALADINGGLKADIAGIFKVSGSFEQRQSSVARQDSTSVSLFRYGGESGSIAYDLAGLKDSIRELTQDAAEAPKPIRIGVLPYSALDNQPDVTQPISAFDYSPEINSYFLARDVFEKTSDAIDAFAEQPANPLNRDENTPIAIAREIQSYIDLNDRAMRLASELSNALRLCQGVITDVNIINAQTLSEGTVSGEESVGQEASSTTRLPLIANAASTDSGNDQLKTFSDLASIVDPISDSTLQAKYDACRPSRFGSTINTPSFFYDAILTSLDLAAEELSLRPIYWQDLGVRVQNEFVEAAKLKELQDNPAQAQSKYIEIFQEYTRNYRADSFRRDICSSDFTHPICTLPDTAQWKLKAVLDSAAMKVDVVQIGQVTGVSDG